MIRSRISGTGRAVPPKVLTNADLARMVDTSDAWIVERTGIRERQSSRLSLAASDLAAQAGREACRKAGVDPAMVECIIVGTVTGDCPFPSTATFVQKKLGARPGGCAFDLSAACAGFLYGMSIADAFLRAGQFKNVLVIGVEVLSRITDWTDRGTCTLFGDGAGAVLMTRRRAGPERGVLSTHLFADGSLTDILWQPVGGSREPATAGDPGQQRQFVQMNGREVYKHAVRNMAAGARTRARGQRHSRPATSAWVVAHQANLRIPRGSRIGSGFRCAASSSTSTATATPRRPRSRSRSTRRSSRGRFAPGDLLLFAALGGGLTWASAVVSW